MHSYILEKIRYASDLGYGAEIPEFQSQDCFLQKEARVRISNVFVIEDSEFKLCFLLRKMI